MRLLKTFFGILAVIAAIVLALSTLLDPAAGSRLRPISSTSTNQVSELVYLTNMLSNYDLNQIRCLADNTYFEAGNQNVMGKIAVNNVVMNRVNDPQFPNTPCGVIQQRNRKVCQFSWVCKQEQLRVRSQRAYRSSERIAIRAYLNDLTDVTRGSLFYHADYVNPDWNLKQVIVIGSHIFYKQFD